MATVNKSGQLHSKASNGDILKLYPNTLIANVEGLQSALDGKVNTVSGKGLSANDYTTAEKNKLAGIAAGATANIGTVTQVKVGSTAYNPSSGVVSLPAYPTTLPASDVSSWAKASTKPSYTASEVGLGNVGNFKAVSTVASQGLTDTEKSNARANIGAGTSSFSGSYNDLSNKPTIPTKTSQLTNDSGYTTNTGTVTSVKVGSTSYSPSSGVVSLPAYPTTLPASDVSAWAKASSKPSYTYSEVGAAASSHTHNYAGSSSAGGAATSAAKLTNTSKIGDTNKPVYFKADGTPAAISYTIDKSVPSNAVFTDTTYSAATQSAAGLMSATDKAKLDGVATGANNYSLPDASTSAKGGVKIGNNINVSGGTISLTAANVASALGFTPLDVNVTGLRLVYGVASTSAMVHEFIIDTHDFNDQVSNPACGTYLIMVVNWSGTPSHAMYALSYSGANLAYTALTKIWGTADFDVGYDGNTHKIRVSSAGKVTIYALQ